MVIVFTFEKDKDLKVTHDAGFFSCASVKLENIVNYYNKKGKIPRSVNGSSQFSLYKDNKKRDITYDFFEHYNSIKMDYPEPQ